MPGKKKGTKKSTNIKESLVSEEDVQDTTEEPADSVMSHEAGSGFARQVVEVVEDTTQEESQEVPETAGDEEQFNKTKDTLPQEENPVSEEKREEMVSEMFHKPSPVMPEISMHRGNELFPLITWVVVVIVVALLTGGVLYTVIRRPAMQIPFLTAKPTPTPTLAPTPAPAAVKREDISIQVLNGGGTEGAAGKMKTFLEGKGYTVKDVGNADAYTYEKTVISVKSNKQQYIALLEKDLKDSYTLGTTSATLSGDVSFDARVIVGSQ